MSRGSLSIFKGENHALIIDILRKCGVKVGKTALICANLSLHSL